ncbi:MAG: sensor histidine kinase [Acidimicrobiales bacterium]
MVGAVPVHPARSRHSIVPGPLDLLIAACLVAISVVVAVQAADQAVAGSEAPDRWWEWLIIVLPSIAVAFRRSAPLVAAPIAVIGQMVTWGLDLAEVFVAPLVIIYSVAAVGGIAGRRMALASSVALTGMTALGVAIAPDVGFELLVLTGLSSTAALLLGTNAANQQAASARLAADLAVERWEHEAAQERAVVRERERIAHELHDLVGHSLSVIAVRAEAAQRVGATRPEVLVDAVGAIGATARTSLAEVRRILHAGLGDADADLRPGPSLVDVPGLVNDVSGLGYEVALAIHGPVDPADVDAATGAGTYRIVQEALTNVVKHAGPGATVRVDVALEADAVRIEVQDDGRGPTPGDEAPTGLGLTGMAERARFLGGTLEAGAAPGGGFRVRADIPRGDTS